MCACFFQNIVAIPCIVADDLSSSFLAFLYTSIHLLIHSNLYYLESIHMDGWDMWSTIRYKEKMVGTHASLAKIHLFEILEALEFCHERGVVHRDLKAENLLLSPTGHVILIDFGTAKDLIHTEFNGPEFVGTPDFMAPEAVKGESRPEEVVKQRKIGGGADHTLDLWSFGALAFQLLTGSTPFSSPSQYLAYLRIQRGMLCRPMGLTDDKVWDLITKLMKTNPKERLGSDCFEYDKEKEGSFKMINKANGYKTIREHPYFVDLSSTPIDAEETRVFPSLRDLCLRAVSQLVENDSTNLNIDKEHPQGGGSSHDMLRLNKADRGCVMELLEKLRVLSNPRVYRRFFETKREARLTKVRQNTRDYIGLTQMKDKQYQFPVLSSNDNVDTERSDVLETVFPILFMHITNPLFVKKINISCTDEERQAHIAELKKKLKVVNVTRPKLVVASGYLDDECRKLLGKVSESIPVVLNDGEAFYSFWSCGGHGLVLRAADFIGTDSHNARKCEQIEWLKEELEQNEMTRHHAYAFVDCKPDQLPKWLLKKLAKGRVMCLFGLSDGAVTATEFIYRKSLGKNTETEENHDFDDDASQSSADSHEEEDRHMEIIGRGDSSVLCWKLEEGGAWNFENMGQ
jgi:serine/threonine protein kinase